MGKIAKLSNGVFYFNGYTQVTDPGFAAASPVCAASNSACNGLAAGYSNKTIVAPNGQMILVNPQPGEKGTLGYSTLRGPSFFDLDMNIVKRFQIMEKKQFELRLDVINVLNHPNFAAPSLNINGAAGTFGQINALAAGTNVGGNGGMRSILLNTRINF